MSDKSKSNSKINIMVDYIRKNFRSDISISDLEQLSKLKYRTLYREFVKNYGMSPKKFILWTRIESAQNDLLSTTKKIEEIALENGFYDQSSFIQLFKRETKTTPLKFRQEKTLTSKKEKFNYSHEKRFSKVLDILGVKDASKTKFMNSNHFNEIQQNSKTLYDKRLQLNRNFYSENKDYFRDYDKNYKKSIREQNDKMLNEFYLKNNVPKFLWNEIEFKSEHDYQTALQWSIVNKFEYPIQPWLYLEKTFGFPDIYIQKLHLIIEVKLRSILWERSKIIKQILKYKDFAEVVVVSLDGKPKHWNEGDESEFANWFNTQELFCFLQKKFDLVST